MLEAGVKPGERLSLAPAQALRASGAEEPGLVGVLHWQAAHLAWPLRALKAAEHAPLGRAAGRVLVGARVDAGGDGDG